MDPNFITIYVIRVGNSSAVVMEILYVTVNEMRFLDGIILTIFIHYKFLESQSLIHGSVTEVMTFCLPLQASLCLTEVH